MYIIFFLKDLPFIWFGYAHFFPLDYTVVYSPVVTTGIYISDDSEETTEAAGTILSLQALKNDFYEKNIDVVFWSQFCLPNISKKKESFYSCIHVCFYFLFNKIGLSSSDDLPAPIIVVMNTKVQIGGNGIGWKIHLYIFFSKVCFYINDAKIKVKRFRFYTPRVICFTTE